MKIPVLLATLLLYSCAQDQPKAHDYCLLMKPICLAPGEVKVLSKGTKDQIDQADDTYDALCNPSGKPLCN